MVLLPAPFSSSLSSSPLHDPANDRRLGVALIPESEQQALRLFWPHSAQQAAARHLQRLAALEASLAAGAAPAKPRARKAAPEHAAPSPSADPKD